MREARIRTVAFIGTGIMGSAIAGHLLDAGYELIVHNRTKAKADALVAAGASWADTVEAAASAADVTFTMLGFPSDVEEVYLSTGGLLDCVRKGGWMVDLTTSSPQLARDIHDAAEIMDKHAFDCPVTGGEEGARAGTLTCMVGSTAREAAAIAPLLGSFASKLLYFDAPGAGQTAKLCNQVALAANMVGYAEALALAREAGIAPEKVRDLVQAGTGASAAMEKLAPLSLAGDYRPRFLAEHLLKDLGLALFEAGEMGLDLPVTEASFALFELLCKIGGSRLGTQALSLLYAGEDEGVRAGLDWSLLSSDDEGAEDSDADFTRYHLPNRF